MKKWLSILVFLLAGCAGEQALQSRHYLLLDSPGQSRVQLDSPLLVVRVDLADYLNSSSLLYRTSETEVVYARHNLWAEELDLQLTRRIVGDLQFKQAQYRPVVQGAGPALGAEQQLFIGLQRFNGAHSGNAEIFGEWFLFDREGQILEQQSFQFEVPLQQDGYEALIQALSEGVGQLTDSLVVELNQRS